MSEPVDAVLARLEVEDIVVDPPASDDELTAILLAYEQLWPRSTISAPQPAPRWRFAGREWGDRPSYGGWR